MTTADASTRSAVSIAAEGPAEPGTDNQFDHHSLYFSNDPAAVHARLRAGDCPVTRSDRYGGFWVLNRYQDVVAVAKAPELYSSRNDGGRLQGITIPTDVDGPQDMPPVTSDPPTHFAYRRLLNPFFSSSSLEQLQPSLEAMTDWCLDQRVETGAIDLVLDVANPIPAMATLWLLGLPLDGWETWAEPFHDAIGMPRDSLDRPRIAERMAALNVRIGEVIAAQRTRPTGGILAALLSANTADEPIDETTIAGLCFLLMAAGVDTTTALLSGTFEHLDAHPELRIHLAENPALLPAACEEFVRYLTPNPTEARTVCAETELAGVPLRSGDRVLISWFAANHDPAEFDRPDEVLLDRPRPHRHVGFGAGVHRCVGAPLARMVFLTVVPKVLERIGDFRLDRSRLTPYEDRGSVNGFFEMPARFTPAPGLGAKLPTRL